MKYFAGNDAHAGRGGSPAFADLAKVAAIVPIASLDGRRDDGRYLVAAVAAGADRGPPASAGVAAPGRPGTAGLHAAGYIQSGRPLREASYIKALFATNCAG